ncbi:unnamed protein product [Prunus armeniaca]|uniref:Uncharacterized protein n=1 Tax=Prunus armeniaca TaxID=36596 RepID=A0A6J5VA07_PRUAR|nr:unnamed protein product [Prunus armeniaca]
MEEVEATLLSHEKRRKVEDCQSSVFAAQGRNKKEDKPSRNLVAPIGLNPEMVERTSSATSVRNGAT